MTLIAGYAYPTSTHAAECLMSDTGCYIVTRDHDMKTGAHLKRPVLAMGPFATKADAQKWIRSWQPYKTELTPEGEQTVIPGCERQTTKKNPQGELFS